MCELIATLLLCFLGFLDLAFGLLKLRIRLLQASGHKFLFFSRGLKIALRFFKRCLQLIEIVAQFSGCLFNRVVARGSSCCFGCTRRHHLEARSGYASTSANRATAFSSPFSTVRPTFFLLL